MGQGNMTALALLAAEELDVPVDRVDMTLGDTDLCPWDIGTFGSLSIWQFGPVLRGAAAEARAVLLELASERLGEPVGKLRTWNGEVFVEGEPSRSVAYGALVGGRRVERHLKEVRPKPVHAFAQVGRDAQRLDARAKVTGNSLRQIPEIFDLSATTIRVVKQNLFWAFFYNSLGISLAIAGILNPILAAAAMFLSSVSVSANSLRLARRCSGR